jgi:hypothetical protein
LPIDGLPIGECRFGLLIADWIADCGLSMEWRLLIGHCRLFIVDWGESLLSSAIGNRQSESPVVNRQSQSAIDSPNRQSSIPNLVNLQSAFGNRQ